MVIGPLPPPLAGTSVSFKLFCDFLTAQSDNINIRIVNTAPKKLGTRPLLDLSNLVTASRVLSGCLKNIRKSNKVILFGSNQFLLSMMPICLLVAKLFNKPFYVRSFGGSLDSYYLNRSPKAKKYFRWVLNQVDGLIVETESLNVFFQDLLSSKVHFVPGYRDLTESRMTDNKAVNDVQHKPEILKLVFVGHVKEQKGVFDLLESVNMLNKEKVGNEKVKVECDFFGPVYDEDAARFHEAIAQTNGANYGGVLEPHHVISTITKYDLFVFPTYYSGEGHPGVVIEAMMAGMPIITTNFKSIPDLVKHRVNGLLVTPNNPRELADAIQLLFDDKELMKAIEIQSALSGKQYCSSEVIPVLLKAIDVDF